jgi:uncharacterized protein (TIRG00374 family)
MQRISWSAFVQALALARWEWALLALAALVLSLLLKALRWQTLFPPPPPTYGRLWSAYIISQMMNAALPARAGDLGRVALVADDCNVAPATTLSTVVVEKVIDLVMLALAYLIVVLWLSASEQEMPSWLQAAGRSLIPVRGLSIAALLLLLRDGRWLWQWLRKLLSALPQRWRDTADSVANQAIDGLQGLQQGSSRLQVWVLSTVTWTLTCLYNGLMLVAFGLDLSPFVAILLVVVLTTGVAMPPLPGTLGVFAYLCQLVLSLFGVSREYGLAYGITLQVLAFLPAFVFGIVHLILRGRRMPGGMNSSGAAK